MIGGNAVLLTCDIPAPVLSVDTDAALSQALRLTPAELVQLRAQQVSWLKLEIGVSSSRNRVATIEKGVIVL